MKYRVEVWITDTIHGVVTMEADSPEEAQEETAELIRESSIDTTVIGCEED